ncbi:MAG: hypothetical protein A2156_04325 [Deltaproteobacteria bacterium RBG_16_48_10]|nr:MAG: hypothetical protein A2156_04325 [Deltaproteobacteria bacterium RBG_16_48_10]
MGISQFIKQKSKSFCSFFNRQSAIFNPHSFRFFSLRQQRVLLILALFVLALPYFRFDHPTSLPLSDEIVREFVVEVSGEVRYPGIHLFKNSPTLEEVIEKAEGLNETALFDTSSSEFLERGTLVAVVKKNPDEIKVKLGGMEAKKLLVFSIPLDLNQATEEDLSLVPGIGESLAKEIITYRERRKAFGSIDELKEVKGIGGKKYRSLKPFLTVK